MSHGWLQSMQIGEAKRKGEAYFAYEAASSYQEQKAYQLNFSDYLADKSKKGKADPK